MYIAKDKDLIVYVDTCKQRLKNQLKSSFIKYDKIEKTDDTYILYNGKYIIETKLTKDLRNAIKSIQEMAESVLLYTDVTNAPEAITKVVRILSLTNQFNNICQPFMQSSCCCTCCDRNCS